MIDWHPDYVLEFVLLELFLQIGDYFRAEESGVYGYAENLNANLPDFLYGT